MILCDSREPKYCQANGLNIFGPERFRVDTLRIGDVLVDGAVVERKEVKDLINSAISSDKHLKSQATRMTAFDTRILVIEGSFMKLCQEDPRYQKYNSKWFYGLCASLNVNYGIMTFQVPNNEEFWKFIERLAYKIDKKKEIDTSPIYTPKVTKKNKSVPLSQICVVPGINEKIGLSILEKYNPYDLYTTTQKELENINGVGPVLAKRIKSVYKPDRGVKDVV